MVGVSVTGRILDREFEEQIRAHAKAAGEDASKAVENAKRYLEMAEKFGMKEEKQFEGLVKEHPMAFVLGAFAGGVLVGAMIAKRG